MAVNFYEELVNNAKGIKEAIQALVKAHLDPANPGMVDSVFEGMLDGSNTTRLFQIWWPMSDTATYDSEGNVTAAGQTRYQRLERWFRMLKRIWGEKNYTLRWPLWSISSGNAMTPMADLAGKTALKLYTKDTPIEKEWADDDPMTWYIRANALSLADGTMNILAIEGIDSDFDLTGNTAPVYTFHTGLWMIWFQDSQYEYKTFSTVQKPGMWPMACAVKPDNTARDMVWFSTFPGSLTAGGKLTSGVGNQSACSRSAGTGIADARKWNAYEGTYTDADWDYVLNMWQLMHWNLENGGILEGCTSYNIEKATAVAETGTKRVILATADAAGYIVGSTVSVGTASKGKQVHAEAEIERIEEVSIEGNSYTAIYLKMDDTMDVEIGNILSTQPWIPGSTELVPGHKDGSPYHLTNGKNPARVAGIEVVDGAYAVGLDPLCQMTQDAEDTNKRTYHIYEARDSEKQASSVGAYTDTGIEFVCTATGWNWYKHLRINQLGLMIPEEIPGASASTYYKSAFHAGSGSGLRALWRFGNLSGTGGAGLACGHGSSSPGGAGWNERPRLSGSGKKRGEWTA